MAYWDGQDEGRYPPEEEPRSSRAWVVAAAIGLMLAGGFVGGVFGNVVPATRTVTETKVIKTLVQKPQPAPPPDPCQSDEPMTIQKVYSEKVSLDKKDDKDAWTWGNVVVLAHQGSKASLICSFRGSAELQKVLDKGMLLKPSEIDKVVP